MGAYNPLQHTFNIIHMKNEEMLLVWTNKGELDVARVAEMI
jgi:hypothetical protein